MPQMRCVASLSRPALQALCPIDMHATAGVSLAILVQDYSNVVKLNTVKLNAVKLKIVKVNIVKLYLLC